MTEEEKKAIEHFKKVNNWYWKNIPEGIYDYNNIDFENMKILLNLVEKQKIELEVMRDVYKMNLELVDENGRLKEQLKNK